MLCLFPVSGDDRRYYYMTMNNQQQEQKKQERPEAYDNAQQADEMQEPVEEGSGGSYGDDDESQAHPIGRQKIPAETTSSYNTYDVLLGRGRAYQLYPGNRRFHTMINSNAERYANSSVQSGKWKITMEIVEGVLAKGRFLKANKSGGWTVIPPETARQKVAHALQYQNRRLSTKERKMAAKAPNEEVPPAQRHQPDVDLSDTEPDMSAYPNISRVYFSNTAPVQDGSSYPPSSRSATEKFLHGIVTHAPHRQSQPHPTSTSMANVGAPVMGSTLAETPHHHQPLSNPIPISYTVGPVEDSSRLGMNTLAPNPRQQYDPASIPARCVDAPRNVANSSISNVDHGNFDTQRLTFRGFRALPFYSTASEQAPPITTRDTNCESKYDSRMVGSMPVARASPPSAAVASWLNSSEHVDQQWIGEPDTSSLELLSTCAESPEATDFNRTAHHPEELSTSPSHSWDHHFDEARLLLATIYTGTASRETEQALPEATREAEDQGQSTMYTAMAPHPYVPPHAPDTRVTTTRPPRFFPIDTDEASKVGDEGDLGSLDLYELLEDDFHREQQHNPSMGDSTDHPPFFDG